MNNGEKYERLLQQLRRSEPSFEGESQLAEKVIQAIQTPGAGKEPPPYPGIIFGWTHIGWMRTALSCAACMLVGVFLFQMVELNRKVSRLEMQLLPSGYTYYESPYQPFRELIEYGTPETGTWKDSIKISRKDLFELLNSARRMQFYQNVSGPGPDNQQNMPGTGPSDVRGTRTIKNQQL